MTKLEEILKEEFFDKPCPKGGNHIPELIGDTFKFRCIKCKQKE